MSAMNAIGFTGTRRGLTDAQREQVERLRHYKPEHFLHGACAGANRDAAFIAMQCGTHVSSYPGDASQERWSIERGLTTHMVRTYKDRNRIIVLHCDLLIACPSGMSEQFLAGGTWMMIRMARKLKKRHIIVWPDGTLSKGGVA